MEVNQKNLTATFSLKRALIPILIGLAFSAYSIYASDFDMSQLKNVSFSIPYLILAVVMMSIRDLAYIIRIRFLTEKKLGWKDAFQVIMLWEFSSAVTPTMVGGSAFAVYFLNKEGFNWGKSTGIVMITAMLDELFYIVAVAVSLLILGNSLFSFGDIFGFNPKTYFYIGYSIIIFLTLTILLVVLINPAGTKNVLIKIFSFKWLKKWQHNAERFGNELIETSKELRGKSVWYWLKAFFITTFSWTARFLVLNCLILALNPDISVDFLQQLKIYAEQLVMWVIMLVSPTPGASGVAEIAFSAFFKDYFPENSHAAVAVLWRAISYYPYLILGLLVLPVWVAKVERIILKNLTKKKKHDNEKQN